MNKNIKKIIKVSSLTILGVVSLFTTTQAYSWVEEPVKSAVSENYNLIKYFGEEAGLKMRKDEDYAPINEYMQIIAYFETRIMNDTKNSCYRGGVNTAKGYFQFLNGTYWWVYDMIRGTEYIEGVMPEFPEGRYIYEYSYAGQAQFSITLWNKMAGSDTLKGIYERDYDAGYKVYCKYHHTDCSSQLSPTRFKELKDALRNWSNDLYYMPPEKRARIEQERREKQKKELKKAIQLVTEKVQELIEKKAEEDGIKKEKSKKITKVKKYKLGEYGEFEDSIKRNLSNRDKRDLQIILNNREVSLSRHQKYIYTAKNKSNASSADIKKAIDNYNSAKEKYDVKIKPFMIEE